MAEEQSEKSLEKADIQMIRGVPFARHFKKEIIEGILDFTPEDDDIIIATYPKTGTTWMQYIVLQILTRSESFPTFNDMLERVVPFLEMSGVAAVEEMTTRPRVYKHHMPYSAVKKNPKSKIIYVYRKPDDTLVSFYHMMKNMYENLDFDDHFNNFVNGTISYGRYFEHILSYLEHHEEGGNILLVSYEKLQIHRKEEIMRIAKFLGEEYYDVLLNDKSILNKIIENTSFDYMKKHLKLSVPEDPKENIFSKEGPRKEVDFFRKGIIGDGKETLTKEQFDQLKSVAEKIMEGNEMLSEWYDHSI